MNHTPTPWKLDGMRIIAATECVTRLDCNYSGRTPCPSDTQQANAAFIVQAVNAHEEAMELLERVTIELHRKIISGGMETNVAESLGLDELLIDIENLLAKAGVKP